MATVTITRTITEDVEISDGDVVRGLTPNGRKTTNRYRIGGEWVYASGKKTNEPDEFYAQKVADGELELIANKADGAFITTDD